MLPVSLSHDVWCTLYIDEFMIFVLAKIKHIPADVSNSQSVNLLIGLSQVTRNSSGEKTVVLKFEEKGDDP